MKNPSQFKSKVIIAQDFPLDHFDVDKCILLYDKVFESKELDAVVAMTFIEQFPNRVGVKTGESLKDFKSFPKNLERVLAHWPEPLSRQQNLVVMGGGSLGDFGGFIASVLKRGVGLIHIPSTWLAAMDSSHGGKTGLNYEGVKNQIGTFYPAESVYIVRSLLEVGSKDLMAQSFGELVKMALIGSSQFYKEILMEKRSAHDFMWRFLPHCIEDKYDVILQDPLETKNIRQVLNFGHTFGHALESHFGWAHGDAVLQGLFFSLQWSVERGFLSSSLYEQILKTIADRFDRVPANNLDWYKKPSAKVIKKLIQADKKMDADGSLLFVFLKKIGQAHLEQVSIDIMIDELKRLNWVR